MIKKFILIIILFILVGCSGPTKSRVIDDARSYVKNFMNLSIDAFSEPGADRLKAKRNLPEAVSNLKVEIKSDSSATVNGKEIYIAVVKVEKFPRYLRLGYIKESGNWKLVMKDIVSILEEK